MPTTRTDPLPRIAPVQEKPPAPEREPVRPGRTFAERLAEAVHAAGLSGQDASVASAAKQDGLWRGLGVPMSGGWWVELGEARRKKRRSGGRQGV